MLSVKIRQQTHLLNHSNRLSADFTYSLPVPTRPHPESNSITRAKGAGTAFTLVRRLRGCYPVSALGLLSRKVTLVLRG